MPIKKVADEFRLTHTPKDQRLAERRREQATEAFRENYRKRSGGESTNSGLKRRMGLGRLRVRGRRAVEHAAYLRVAGWNILRAAASPKLRAKLAAAGQKALEKRTASATCEQTSLPRLTSRYSNTTSQTSRLKIIQLCVPNPVHGATQAA